MLETPTESFLTATPQPNSTTWSTVFAETFDTGWGKPEMLGRAGTLVSMAGNRAIQPRSDNRPTLVYQSGYNAAFQAQVQFTAEGSVRFFLRQNVDNAYEAVVASSGQISIARSGEVIATATLPAFALHQWRFIRFEAVDNTLHLALDGVTVLVAVDTELLTEGYAGYSGSTTVLLDNIAMQVAQTESVTESQALIAPQAAMSFNLMSEETTYPLGESERLFYTHENAIYRTDGTNTVVYIPFGASLADTTTIAGIGNFTWSDDDYYLAFECVIGTDAQDICLAEIGATGEVVTLTNLTHTASIYEH